MQSCVRIDEALDAIQAIRARADSFTTSLYAPQAEVKRWLDAGALWWLDPGGSFFLLRPSGNFHRLYHAAADAARLKGLGQFMQECDPGTEIVADLIGKAPRIEQDVAAYHKFGFEEHAVLVRMALVADGTAGGAQGGAQDAFATREDLASTEKFLSRVLDPIRDRIPERTELLSAIDGGTVLVVRRGAEICGLLYFEVSGVTSLLRYWYVEPELAGRGIGGRLMRLYLRLCSGKRRILLWAVRESAATIAIYRHYGFREDALIDHVMVKRKVSQ
jgi:GNAT superfamily N-acetyltransferase